MRHDYTEADVRSATAEESAVLEKRLQDQASFDDWFWSRAEISLNGHWAEIEAQKRAKIEVWKQQLAAYDAETKAMCLGKKRLTAVAIERERLSNRRKAVLGFTWGESFRPTGFYI